VKKAEGKPEIVVRVFEIQGAATETPIELLGRKRTLRPANLLEQPEGSDQQILRLRPYEIGTALVRVP
jgi:alpha-mannosidase